MLTSMFTPGSQGAAQARRLVRVLHDDGRLQKLLADYAGGSTETDPHG
jgi:hypothetical protein